MARVPQAELERLKREVSVVRLAEARGVELRRHGQDLLGLCPFHDDKEPSLVISPEKNLWHCLGACGEGGSVIDWVMKSEGVSFRHAVELLRADLPAVSTGAGADRPPPKTTRIRKLASPLDADAADQELLAQVVAYYHETLKESPEGLEYLRSRGLVHGEMVEHFRLGLSNRTLGLRLPARSRKAGAEIRGRLIDLGIYRESGHEHFNGCLVIPVFDEAGRVAELYGRKLRRASPGYCPHLYLPGPHRGVWNRDALVASREVILTESLIDALTFWSAGYRNVTAAYGTQGFTEEMLAAFAEHEVERVLVAFDRDDAGEKAAEKVAERLAAVGIGCSRVLFPRGMDANEYALRVTPPAKSLGLVLRHAEWRSGGREPAPEAALEVVEPEALEAPPETGETAPPLPSPPPAPAPPLAAGWGEPPSPGPPAAPTAPAAPQVPTEVKPEELVIRLGDRRYRVRGLEKNTSYSQLRVNLLASRSGGPDGFHVDTLDLYAARQRTAFIHQAAQELGVTEEVVKQDVGRVLLKLEELQDEQIRRALEPAAVAVVLSPEERSEALSLLRDPELGRRIVEDLGAVGLVGEETNKLVGYLAAVSRKLRRPLAVVVQSSSAAGKSALMEAVLDLVPEEERVAYSAMTGQSLFYMGESDLAHKVLAVAEEEGAERASYALKLLQSEGELTIASTGKDPQTGRLVTHEYRVAGPVAIFLTTTAIDVDEELLNRCLVLSVSEEREQTRAIHRLQRERRTLEGLLAAQGRGDVVCRHRNAQRLLRPLAIVNPYAPELTFLDSRTRTRRDHEKYLTLIDAIALLHQYQRKVKTVAHRGRVVEYVEVELADIELANRLAGEVLGRSLDELPPQTRRLLELLDRRVTEVSESQAIARSEVRFTRRQVREATGWRDTQLRLHLGRLAEMEYLVVHQGGRGRSFLYELIYEATTEAPERFIPGLIDVARLREGCTYDANLAGANAHLAGQDADLAGPTRPQRGGVAGGARGQEKPAATGVSGDSRPKSPIPAHLEPHGARHRRSSAPRPLAAPADGGQ
jgi:DNA primase catalytic core